jgi:hypothetical protein
MFIGVVAKSARLLCKSSSIGVMRGEMATPGQNETIEQAHQLICKHADQGLRAAWLIALARRALGDPSMCLMIAEGVLMPLAFSGGS